MAQERVNGCIPHAKGHMLLLQHMLVPDLIFKNVIPGAQPRWLLIRDSSAWQASQVSIRFKWDPSQDNPDEIKVRARPPDLGPLSCLNCTVRLADRLLRTARGQIYSRGEFHSGFRYGRARCQQAKRSMEGLIISRVLINLGSRAAFIPVSCD